MIDCMIFTKDRACQLELLLRSIQEKMPSLKHITIIVKATTPAYNAGYQKIFDKYPFYNWVRETNLINNIKSTISMFRQPYCVTFVDDEVLVNNNAPVPALQLLESNKDIHCISLRMHPEIEYTYTSNTQSPPPATFVKYKRDDDTVYKGLEIFTWDWRKHSNSTDWGYPSCINSHIYRTDMFKQLTLQPQYANVNQLEGVINNQRERFAPKMACYSRPSSINIANNLIQDGTNRHGTKPEFTPDNLNKKLLEGFIISSRNLYGLKQKTATFECDYLFDRGWV